MQEKSKRKGNPRRRFLFKLVLGIGILGILVALLIDLLSPKQPSIVYIANDDTGRNNLFLLDITQPDQPQQVTFFEHPILVYSASLRVASGQNIASIVSVNGGSNEIWSVNVQTNDTQFQSTCTCSRAPISDDGQWVAYTTHRHDVDSSTIILNVLNIHTGEHREIAELGSVTLNDINQFYIPDPEIHWIAGTQQILFLSDLQGEMYFKVYSYDLATDELTFITDRRSNFPFLPAPDGQFVYAVGHELIMPIDEYHDPNAGIGNFDERESRYDERFRLNNPHFGDWHPDSQHFVLYEHWETSFSDGGLTNKDLTLYHSDLGEIRRIYHATGAETIYDITFNGDGSLLLFSVRNLATREDHLIIHNMNNGENAILPFYTRFPQWVD